MGRLRAYLVRLTARQLPGQAPRWRSPLQLSVATIAFAVCCAILGFITVGGTARWSATERTGALVVALCTMLALSLGSWYQVNVQILNLIHLRAAAAYNRAVPDIQWTVAYHNLTAAVYRGLGKLCIVATMGAIVLRQNADVAAWNAEHPLLVPGLLLCAMLLFVCVEIIVTVYQRQERAMPAPLTLEAAVEMLSRQITTLAAEHGREIALIKDGHLVLQQAMLQLQTQFDGLKAFVMGELSPAESDLNVDPPAADPSGSVRA